MLKYTSHLLNKNMLEFLHSNSEVKTSQWNERKGGGGGSSNSAFSKSWQISIEWAKSFSLTAGGTIQVKPWALHLLSNIDT